MITNLLQEIRDRLAPLGAIGEQIASIIEALASLDDIAAIKAALDDVVVILQSLDTTADNIDINVTSIDDNVASALSRLTNLLNKVTSIDTTTQGEAANVNIIKNYLQTMTPDVSSASDFAEQIATNTLEIKNHQVSLDADSTEQIALLRRIINRLDDIYNYMTGGTP